MQCFHETEVFVQKVSEKLAIDLHLTSGCLTGLDSVI